MGVQDGQQAGAGAGADPGTQQGAGAGWILGDDIFGSNAGTGDGSGDPGTGQPGSGQTGSSGSGGAGSNQAGGQQGQGQPEVGDNIEALKAENARLQARLDTLSQYIVQPEYVNRVQGRQAQAPQPQGQPQQPQEPAQPPASSVPEPDWDTATPKQLADYVIAKTKEEVLTTYGSQVQSVEQRVQTMDAQQQIQEATKKYPDFWSYRQTMALISRRHPTLSAEELYHLAKSQVAQRMPQRGQQLQGQQQPQRRQQAPATRATQGTERPGISPAATATGSVSASQAAETAFERVFGKGR